MVQAFRSLDSGLAGGGTPVGRKTIQPVRAPGAAPNSQVISPQPQPDTGPAWNTLGVTPQWDAGSAIPHLKDQFSRLGYTGELYGYGDSPNASGGPSEQDGGAIGGGPQVSAGLQSWLDSNKYSLQGRYVGSDLQTRIADSAGMGVGDPSHYESNDAGWFEKAVPVAIAAMGAGALGYGSGLFGGGAGGGFVSPEALGLEGAVGSETAALGAGQVGALDGAAAVGAGGMSLEAPLSSVLGYENALPAMAGGGTTVGGAVIPGAAGAGLTSQIGGALSSAASWAKANPQLAAMGLSGATSLLGGSPSAPAQPGSGGSGSGGTSNDALIQKLTEQLYGANGSMANAFDYSKIPGLQTSAGDPNAVNQQAIDAAYSKQTGMLDPQFARDQQALEARLAEQGFVPGTPGYDRAMGVFGETRNKAYGSARDSSILQGYQIGQGQFGNQLSNAQLNNNASNSALAQALQERNQPLNELNALKGGQQLAYENQLGQYNADVASSNSKNQALSQLALALGIYLG